MTRANPRTDCDLPYRRQKRPGRSDSAFTEVDGRRVHLGVYGSEASFRKLREVAALARGGGSFGAVPATVADLFDRYERHAFRYYRKNGKPTATVERIEFLGRVVRQLFGEVPATEFRAGHLKAVREEFVRRGYTRPGVNRMATMLRSVYRWAAEEFEQDDRFAVAASRLIHVAPLKRGRTPAPDPEPVRPALEQHVAAVEPFVSPQVWAMIQVQMLTGARPGEVVTLRGDGIDRDGDIWTCRLEDHKNAHHGLERYLHFGPKAQDILGPWIARSGGGYLFNPRDGMLARRRVATTGPGRRPGQTPTPLTGNVRKPIGEHYSTGSYTRAVVRACEAAGVPKWTPNQLRHTFATSVRRLAGLDVAQAALGHKHASTTEIYAEIEKRKAHAIFREVG